MSHLEYILASASRAPSVHNAQPWRVIVRSDETIEVYERTELRLPAADPTGRGSLMALGAFVENLFDAARATGFEASIVAFPSGASGPVATIQLERVHALHHDSAVLDAIERRATNRSLFTPLTNAEDVAHSLGANRPEGATIVMVRDTARLSRIAELIREGTRAAYQSKAFCVEHAAWLRSNWTRRRDGIPGYAVGIPPLLSLALPTIIRHKDVSAMRADMEYKKACSSNLFAVILASEETPRGWFVAGRRLQRLLLDATRLGIASSPNAAPIEMGGLVAEVQKIAGAAGHPQLLVRLGRAAPIRRLTPRRALADFVAWDAERPSEPR